MKINIFYTIIDNNSQTMKTLNNFFFMLACKYIIRVILNIIVVPIYYHFGTKVSYFKNLKKVNIL